MTKCKERYSCSLDRYNIIEVFPGEISMELKDSEEYIIEQVLDNGMCYSITSQKNVTLKICDKCAPLRITPKTNIDDLIDEYYKSKNKIDYLRSAKYMKGVIQYYLMYPTKWFLN